MFIKTICKDIKALIEIRDLKLINLWYINDIHF